MKKYYEIRAIVTEEFFDLMERNSLVRELFEKKEVDVNYERKNVLITEGYSSYFFGKYIKADGRNVTVYNSIEDPENGPRSTFVDYSIVFKEHGYDKMIDIMNRSRSLYIVDVVRTIKTSDGDTLYMLDKRDLRDASLEDFTEAISNTYGIDGSKDKEFLINIVNNYIRLIDSKYSGIFNTERFTKLFMNYAKKKIDKQDFNFIRTIFLSMYDVNFKRDEITNIFNILINYMKESYTKNPLSKSDRVKYLIAANLYEMYEIDGEKRHYINTKVTYYFIRVLTAMGVLNKTIIEKIDEVENEVSERDYNELLKFFSNILLISNNTKRFSSPATSLLGRAIINRDRYPVECKGVSFDPTRELYKCLLELGIINPRSFGTIFKYLGSLLTGKDLNDLFIKYTGCLKDDLKEFDRGDEIEKYYEIMSSNAKVVFNYYFSKETMARVMLDPESKIYKRVIMKESLKEN